MPIMKAFKKPNAMFFTLYDKFKSFEHNQIQIKLSFEDPLDVSLGEYLDMLEVKLLESYFLRI